MPTDYYKKQLESGLQFQDFVYEILGRHGIMTVGYSSRLFQQRLGENKARIEIKFDKIFSISGRFWIETFEKSDPQRIEYVPSGIQRDSIEYLIGNYDEIYRFATSILRLLWQSGKYPEVENKLKTSLGFFLDRDVAQRFCMQHILIDCGKEFVTLVRSYEESKKEVDLAMAQLLQKMHVDPNQIDIFGLGLSK